MKVKLYILVELLLIANIANGYDITGVVTGKGEPLPGVVITRIGFNGTDADSAYAVSDIDGRFTIDSGTGDPIMITASFASYMSDMKWANGSEINFDLKETPFVPVKFFSSLLDQSRIISYMMEQQIKGVGNPELADVDIFLSDDALVFSINSTKDSAASGLSIQNFADTTIKGYLRQLQTEGELENFITQMKNSRMKWDFGVYSKTSNKWLQHIVYDANRISKLLQQM